MKILKWLLTISILVSVPLMFNVKALCAPSAQDLYDFYSNTYTNITGSTIPLSNWQSFVNSAPNYNNHDKYYMGVGVGNGFTQTYVFGVSDSQVVSVYNESYGSGFNCNTGTMQIYIFNSSGTYTYNQTAGSITGLTTNYVNEIIVVDFSNVMYLPGIPTPVFSVYYNDDTTTMPRFNLDIQLENASDEYFVYVTMDNSTPISYGIAYNGQMYNVSYHKFATREIVSRQSLTQSDTLSMQVLSGLLSSGWRNDINTIDDLDIEVSAISDGAYFNESSPSFIAWKTQLLNFRKIALFYGNSNTISVQYFKVVDGNVYAGEIKSWNNLNGGTFTVTIPKYFVPNNPANGFEVVTIERPLETANPLTTIPDNQFGYRTGGDITINVGSNVPNYPDYPTIATYNLDNILVSTIDNAKHLGTFFTEVSGFCVATFAWIPKEIWQIVALGFALSIVVMFVKIL